MEQMINVLFVENLIILLKDCKIDEYEKSDEINDCCFRCGREGHYISCCYAVKHINGEFLNNDVYEESNESDEINDCCFRCGREGHYISCCYAIKHINGDFLNNDVLYCKYCVKKFTEKKNANIMRKIVF